MTIVLDILTAIGVLTVLAFLGLAVWVFACRNRPPAVDPQQVGR